MQVLKRFASLEEHIIKAVENDVVGMHLIVHCTRFASAHMQHSLTLNTSQTAGRTIQVCGMHLAQKKIVGDCVILLGNLALNEYVKELIRMEDGESLDLPAAACTTLTTSMLHSVYCVCRREAVDHNHGPSRPHQRSCHFRQVLLRSG